MSRMVGGREVPVSWRDRTVRAWLPDRLAEHDWQLEDAPRARAVERARQALVNADTHTPAEWEPLARLLLRAEGVASSYIEGVRAPVPDVVVAQLAPTAASGPAAWVAANLDVLDTAIAHAHTDQPLTLDDLHRWHRALMAGHATLSPHLVGTLRDEQGWIGGATPLDAALVTAPVDALVDLVGDLVRFANRADIDPVTQAAVAHAQFEIIHPYGDGNGRLGRVLILWILARRTGVRVLPPISTRIAADPGAYLAEMTRFRLGAPDSWIRWFGGVVAMAATSVSATMQALANLGRAWNDRLDQAGVRRDATARRVLADLPRYPVLTSAAAAELAKVSERSGRTALATLSASGIVVPLAAVTGRGPAADRYRWWYAPDVTALITAG
jgi:Fic family protein